MSKVMVALMLAVGMLTAALSVVPAEAAELLHSSFDLSVNADSSVGSPTGLATPSDSILGITSGGPSVSGESLFSPVSGTTGLRYESAGNFNQIVGSFQAAVRINAWASGDDGFSHAVMSWDSSFGTGFTLGFRHYTGNVWPQFVPAGGAGDYVFVNYNGRKVETKLSSALATDQFFNVLMTWEDVVVGLGTKETIKVFVGGTEVVNDAGNYNTYGSTPFTHISIGSDATGGRDLDGYVDDLHIFNTVIPEPATIGLLSIGTLIMLGKKRRLA